MIFYISSKERAGLLDEIAEQMGLTVAKVVERKSLNRLIIKDMSNFNHVQFFVADVSALSDDEGEVLEAINAFTSMYLARIIVITGAYTSPGLLAALIRQGVYNIVSASDEQGLQTQLARCFSENGMSLEEAEAVCYGNAPPAAQQKCPKREPPAPAMSVPAPPPLPPPPLPPAAARSHSKRLKQHITVAVCGAGRRIGATHQALQIAKFLNTAGYKACYLEANNHKSIALLDSLYDVSKDSSQAGLMTLDGLDMYYGYLFPEVAARGYDFFVFDLGSFDETPAEAFLTKDVKIIVGGSKAWEIPAYQSVFAGIAGYKEVSFILNFVPENEQGNMLYLLKQFRNRVHFSGYAPYPFDLETNRHIYEKLFENFLDLPQPQATKPRKPALAGNLRGFLENIQRKERRVSALD